MKVLILLALISLALGGPIREYEEEEYKPFDLADDAFELENDPTPTAAISGGPHSGAPPSVRPAKVEDRFDRFIKEMVRCVEHTIKKVFADQHFNRGLEEKLLKDIPKEEKALMGAAAKVEKKIEQDIKKAKKEP